MQMKNHAFLFEDVLLSVTVTRISVDVVSTFTGCVPRSLGVEPVSEDL
jgi:hypothetical protein